MQLGIKVGLKSDWKSDLEATRPQFCEFWFHSGKIHEYNPLFAYCKANNIAVGLHYWGTMPDGTSSNLAYPDPEILKNSRQLIKNTIDAAAKHKSIYVNLHTAGSTLAKVNFETEEFLPFGSQIPNHKALIILKESLQIISGYAKNRGVCLTVESTPARALGTPWTGKAGREKPTFIGEFLVSDLEKILPIDNIYFANDLGHTAGNIISENRNAVKDYLFSVVRRLAPITKLIHVSYVVKPYNGTDYHGCLYYDEVHSLSAVPNYNEIKELLKLFVTRNDVYALVEPEKDHPGNFVALQKLVAEVS